MTPDELEPVLAGLGLAFHGLAWMFYQAPSPESTAVLMGPGALEHWVVDAADRHTRTGLELLRVYREHWGPDALASLTADFNRLFVGPGSLLAPPWESVHRGVDHLLFDHHTLAVRAWYARFGLEAPNHGHEPDDHLGLELAFMGQLCDLAACRNGRKEILQAMGGFLDEHLLCWAPACLGQIQARARTPYYQGLAHLAQGCLHLAVRCLSTFGDGRPHDP
jgi:TorA maturation chaperone TorD